MIKDKSSKELFEYIRTIDTSEVTSLKTILSSYDIQKIQIDILLKKIKSGRENILLIDARSENEFEETSIPCSVNFPLLDNSERHNVGLIYKKYSQSAALYLAKNYADPKSGSLKKFLEANNASHKSIFVYCWRGGGRSSYLAKMISDSGYVPVTLIGGQRSFRKNVNDYFSQKMFPGELIELSGLTGSGKTELIRNVSDNLPVIDLEDAARHYSSLLGFIPYEIKSIQPVKNQSAFENNLYVQIYFNLAVNSQALAAPVTFLIESESKKVGNFEIPKILFEKLQTAPAVKIISTLENRTKRIVKDYFGDDLKGTELMLKKLKEKKIFFRQQLSNKLFDELIILLEQQRVSEFTEIMLKDYYDKRYKDKGKVPVAEISSDNPESAKEEMISVYEKLKK